MGSGNGAAQPMPYWRSVLWSHSSQANTSLSPFVAFTRSCTKSWYELPSLVNRLPWRVTAMTPGLARSMKCGITPLLPSGRVVTDVGTHAAACGIVGSTWPPTASAMRSPSPVLASGEGV